ncbi:hypothetical protein [Lutimonas sp.]|uniref:hypothetical protein n=1 Tax=Lutimonas sp. TaxID=1872403 RepID=UPI003D9BB5FC
MKLFIKKPHFFFIVLIGAFFVLGIWRGNESIDFNIHDTMYVISISFLSIILGLLFALFSLFYWLTDKLDLKLSYWLNLIHILLTVVFMIGVLYVLSYSYAEISELLHRNKIMIFSKIWMFFQRDRIMVFSGFAIIIGALVFLLNLIIGIWKRLGSTSG